MFNSPSVQTRFVVAILCPAATFTHLLQEAQSNKLIVLEMIPCAAHSTDWEQHLSAGTALLFIYGAEKSQLVTELPLLQSALEKCNCNSQ